MNKTVFTSFVILYLLFTVFPMGLTFHIQPVKAREFIYIRSDGSIDPLTANITSADNVTYICINNNYDLIVVERSNIIINGSGYTVFGLSLTSINNVTIINTNIKGTGDGIHVFSSSDNIISGNNITSASANGVLLDDSSDNIISGNNITSSILNGIQLYESSDNIISGNNITENTWSGIWLSANSSYNTISANNITADKVGIDIGGGSNNVISGNNITTGEWYGIRFIESSSNTIYANNIANNGDGVHIQNSSNNTIYRNHFVNNTYHIATDNSTNIWDSGYPLGGNYYNDYIGNDIYNGQFQNETGSDGIGDIPYTIDVNHMDHYPLMGMFYDFHFTYLEEPYHIDIISNSTVTGFLMGIIISNDPMVNGTRRISFNVTGEDETTGFCRVHIPRALLNGTYMVIITEGMQSTEINYTLLACSNSTDGYLYFTYQHSTQKVTIIPEFPSVLVLLLLMIFTLVAVVGSENKRRLIEQLQ